MKSGKEAKNVLEAGIKILKIRRIQKNVLPLPSKSYIVCC